MSEEQEEAQKPVLEVATPPQIEMFAPETKPEVVQSANGGRRFRDPDPREIYLGGRRLDEYLKEAGEIDPIVVRGLLRQMDLSEFEYNYASQGRAPYAPAAMLGLILWGLMKGVTSLRGLEKMARIDLSCMWVSGGITPEFSVIGRFIRRHEQLLGGGEFFGQLTGDIVDLCDSDTSALAGDGSVIEAAASRYKRIGEEAARQQADQAAEEAEKHPEDQQLQHENERAQKAASEVTRRAENRRKKGKDPSKAVVAPSDPDAYVQRQKRGGCAPSYKPSILVNTDRLIISKGLHPSAEKAVVEQMLEDAEQLSKNSIAQLMFDGNYFAIPIIAMAYRKEIDLLVPDGKFAAEEGQKPSSTAKKFHKTDFEYDPIADTMICPAGQNLQPVEQMKAYGTQPAGTRYGGAPCGQCELRSQCTSARAGRTVKRYQGDALKDAMRQVMSQPKAQNRYRKRQAWVEPVFGELRHIQGLQRFRRRGLPRVNVEFSLHAMAHNLRRMLHLLKERRPELIADLRRVINTAFWTFFTLWQHSHSVFGSDTSRTTSSTTSRTLVLAVAKAPPSSGHRFS